MTSTQSDTPSEPSIDKPSRLLLLGHRGTRIYAPENTIEAFDRALADGCDGVEFDVRVTRDGRAIVCHDPLLHRREIGASTLEAFLQVDPKLPTLSDVLCRYASRCFLYIELKVPGAESELVAVLREHPPRRGYVVASFQSEILRLVHREKPDIPLGIIVDQRGALAQWSTLPVSYLMPKHSLVNSGLVHTLHQAGKHVIVWTVNDSGQMQTFANLGVDGIVSDDTALLCRTLGPARTRPEIL